MLLEDAPVEEALHRTQGNIHADFRLRGQLEHLLRRRNRVNACRTRWETTPSRPPSPRNGKSPHQTCFKRRSNRGSNRECAASNKAARDASAVGCAEAAPPMAVSCRGGGRTTGVKGGKGVPGGEGDGLGEGDGTSGRGKEGRGGGAGELYRERKRTGEAEGGGDATGGGKRGAGAAAGDENNADGGASGGVAHGEATGGGSASGMEAETADEAGAEGTGATLLGETGGFGDGVGMPERSNVVAVMKTSGYKKLSRAQSS